MTVMRRPPDETRLPPAGSFRSGVYRLLRALLINQGKSAYRPAQADTISHLRELSNVEEAQSPASTRPVASLVDSPAFASDPAQQSGRPKELKRGAAYWLTGTMLIRYLLPRGTGPPARIPAQPAAWVVPHSEPTPTAKPAVPALRLPPGLRDWVPEAARKTRAAVDKISGTEASDDELVVPRYVEVGVLVVLTLATLLLRVWDLPGSPPGIHGDETEMAMEALRSIRGEALGIWSGVTLGHPAGYAHWMALIFRIGGADVTTMRLASAIPGVLLVPVGYLLVRSLFPFRVALLTAALLAFSFWFVIQSRIAFGGITAVFMALLAMWLLVAAAQSRRSWVAVLAGIALGLGLYTFKTFLLYYIGIWAVALLSMAVSKELRTNRQLLSALGVSLVVGAPMLHFYATSGFIGTNLSGLYHVSLSSPSTWLRMPSLVLNAVLLVHFPVEGNATDGAPAIPILPLSAALIFWVGLVAIILKVHRRRCLLLLAGCVIGMMPVLLVPGVESRRYLLGMFFVLVIVAIGVDALFVFLRRRIRGWLAQRDISTNAIWQASWAIPLILTVALGAVILFHNVREVNRWSDGGSVRWFFGYEYHQTLLFLKELDQVPYIRFYSVRHSFDSSLRRFMLPDATGTDGSREFGGTGELPRADELGGSTIFVLMDEYLPLGELLNERFHGAAKLGEMVENGTTLYTVYLLPES